MKLAGKVEPNTQKLNTFAEYGFDHFELYLDTTILDNNSVNTIVENCTQATPNIATVHTPHISTETPSKKYFKQTDQIAAKLDATLVFDSNPTSTFAAPNLYPSTDITAPTHGYENDPAVSEYYLKHNHLSQDFPLILDTAHLHMSEPTILPFIEELLATCTTIEIPAIHLADGTITNDGLPFGDGTINLEQIVTLIDTYNYNGPVILETPQSAQKDALKSVQQLL